MQITWNGLGSFNLSVKLSQGESTLVTNPYDSSLGLRFPRTLKASAIIQSHKGDDTKNIKAIAGEREKEPFIISHAGEFEVNGIFVKGIRAPKKDGTEHTIYRFTIDGVTIAFLGTLDRELKDKENEALGSIDILIVPVGGGSVADKKVANEVVAQVEPRIIIPSYFAVKGLKEKFDGVEGFCKEAACPNEEQNKLKVKKKSLPVDDMQMVILTK